MICERCGKEIHPLVYKGWNAGGMMQVVKKCPLCKQNISKNKAFYRIEDYDTESLPILYDDRKLYKCSIEGCDNAAIEGTQNHHFFPKYLFGTELAEKAPQARLCKTHHIDTWHKVLTPNMSKKDID